MAAPYLVDLKALIRCLDSFLSLNNAIDCKHFFSGAAAFTNGTIFMSLSPKGLALKLPEDTRAKLMTEGGSPLRYFPKAPIKKDYVVLPQNLVDDPETLAPLVHESILFVG
jgi:TfoX/Sxy family transcriptional regulator of competence genes